MKRLALLVAAVAACAGPARSVRVPAAAGPCEPALGACARRAVDADPRDHLDVAAAMAAAARYWGSDPRALAGWVVVVHGREPFAGAWGFTFGEHRRLDFAVQFPDCPAAVLVHEWGHAADFAAGGSGRPHGRGEDPRFDDAQIMRALGCTL